MKKTLVNKHTVLLNDVYKLNIDTVNSFDEETINLIDKLSINKMKFMEQSKESNKKITLTLSFFADVLLKEELHSKRDILEYSYTELAEVFKKHFKFNSESTYMAVLQVVYNFTLWEYENQLRKDYITAPDINTIVPFEDIADRKELKDKILTPNEIDYIYNSTESLFLKIAVLCAKEGIEISEVVEVKIEEFEAIDNHPLQVTNRELIVSDKLYNDMYEYSKVDSEEKALPRGLVKLLPLAETGYLIRPLTRIDNNSQYNIRSFNNKIKKLLNDEFEIELTYKDIRLSSMLYDIVVDKIAKSNMDNFNDKYNTNYYHFSPLTTKYKLQIDMLLDKIEKEKNFR